MDLKSRKGVVEDLPWSFSPDALIRGGHLLKLPATQSPTSGADRASDASCGESNSAARPSDSMSKHLIHTYVNHADLKKCLPPHTDEPSADTS